MHFIFTPTFYFYCSHSCKKNKILKENLFSSPRRAHFFDAVREKIASVVFCYGKNGAETRNMHDFAIISMRLGLWVVKSSPVLYTGRSFDVQIVTMTVHISLSLLLCISKKWNIHFCRIYTWSDFSKQKIPLRTNEPSRHRSFKKHSWKPRMRSMKPALYPNR